LGRCQKRNSADRIINGMNINLKTESSRVFNVSKLIKILLSGPSHDICSADICYHQSCYLIFNKYSLLMNSEKEQGNGVDIEVENLIMNLIHGN
jgi:hypothetical protein